MNILVTGSAGHLGEALVRILRSQEHKVVGVDILASDCTDVVGSIAERENVQRCMEGVDVVLHTATLHKPHVATHSRHDFVDTNVTGTLNLLEEAVLQGVKAFVFTSTTSTFGDALSSSPGEPATWITEEVTPIPKNIYGATKVAAEDLCQLFFRNQSLPCLILRTSRFFPEEDDNKKTRDSYDDANAKANEFLYRRVDIEDVVSAHLLAMERAPALGFGKYIISATTPFEQKDVAELGADAPAVLQRYIPDYKAEYQRRGWRMFPRLDRVYVNTKARAELGWEPKHTFRSVLERLKEDGPVLSSLAATIGKKGYHPSSFDGRPYPVDE
ncbi:MAG: NAD(P)-dependent oxidoreductase [Deltaproteobacteria bacterium]|nr:MAG: NAD(P)-dependent oxidoreductase [Deltaproteobacteria bacterium]